MESDKQLDITFRPNKNIFILYIVTSIILMMFIIGFVTLIAAILWYKFTYITLTKQGIHMHKGWLNVTDKQVPYEKINTVELQQSLVDRILGSGQLKLYTGNDIQGISFPGLDNPKKAKELIEKAVSNRNNVNPITSQSNTEISSADEISKYEGLRKKGVITQEEFEKKKKQLLS